MTAPDPSAPTPTPASTPAREFWNESAAESARSVPKTGAAGGAVAGASVGGVEEARATVVTGIAELVTNDPAQGDDLLGTVHDAAVVVSGGRVVWVGRAGEAPAADHRVDVGGRAVVPGFVDSHTHAVFAGDRADEFTARMAGRRYDGGGIMRTVTATREADDDALRAHLARLVAEMRAQGTTTVEVKSGYGLTVDDEVRLLRLAREVTPETTFLGAHVVPAGADRADYVALVTGPMLEACAPHARWVDVFCEPASPAAFDGEEARAVLTAGLAAGLLPRVHGNQLGHGPGVQLAVDLQAAAVDHCTYLSDADVAALRGAADDAAAGGHGTVATLLPLVELSTRSPFPDARRLLDAGVEVALATDCNPGTAFSTSMPLAIALAVTMCGMTPAEAVRAATWGGARALRRDDVGVVLPGARADLTVLDAPSSAHMAYRPGVPLARALELSSR